jgi:hypothetical protein
MLSRFALLAPLALAGAAALAQDDAGTLKSGPQPGSLLSSAFHSYNLNGAVGKDRYHCLVCEFGLRPVVLIFARDHPKGQDKALEDLLERVDKAVARDPDDNLRAFVVFLSPAAAASATEPKEAKVTDPEKLVAEAVAREALHARLEPLAKKLRHVAVSTYPAEGPEGYKLSPNADVTVVLYVKQRVTDNFAFPEGGLTEQAVDAIMKRVEALAGRERKARPPAKKEAPKAKDTGKAASARLGRQDHGLVQALAVTLDRHRHGVADVVPVQHVEQLATRRRLVPLLVG